MNPVTSLVCFGLRQVLGEGVENVMAAVERHFTDNSRRLPRALAKANDAAWQALGIALAGDGFLDQIKVFFASGDDKGIREQVRQFLAGKAVSFEGTPSQTRRTCLAELRDARKKNALSAGSLPGQEVARQAAGFQRYADPTGLVDGATRAVAQTADALATDYPNLARLVRQPVAAGPPLLASIFCFFLRREIEMDQELANGLIFDGQQRLLAGQGELLAGLGRLCESQAEGLAQVEAALGGLGERFDQAFDKVVEELEWTRRAAEDAKVAAKETQSAVLDLQAETKRLAGLHSAHAGEVCSLLRQVQEHLNLAGMQRGEVKPRYSFSIRGDDERRAVHALLDRFRQLPGEQRSQLPALLNGLGKLQVGIGEVGAAKETFIQVAAEVSDSAAKAEAYHNAYLAALEKEQWTEALDAITQAVNLDKARFSPFPLDKYRPVRILGAGGFGTVYLCQDAYFKGREVAIKTLHDTDLVRGLDEVFGEAHALMELNHPNIIGVMDCTFHDTENRRRPYIVMRYFQGKSLEKHLQERGPLPPGQLLEVARQVASAMKAAHDRGILHRDLKPDNVLVREAGGQLEAKVIDFGLSLRSDAVDAGNASSTAKSRLTESIAGTAKYAPPEQMGELPGVQPGPYSDVYSFGKMCYAMLFGTPQPDYDDLEKVPSPWKELLRRCTAQKIEKRPKDFGEVLDALQRPEVLETVRAPCPNCPAVLKIPANLLTPGKKVRCPKCSTVFAPIPLSGAGPLPKTAANASVVSSLNPAVCGQAVSFTATVKAVPPATGTPTGTVTFKDGAVVLGTGTLSNGTATLTTSALHAGSHGITVSYAGDALFPASTSTTVAQDVNDAPKKPKRSVLSSIAKFLLAASEKQPVSRAAIIERLTKRFPGRDREKLTARVNSQVPDRIQAARNLVVCHDGKGGYWATRGPRKPGDRAVALQSNQWKKFLEGISSRPKAKTTRRGSSGVRGLRFGYSVGQDEGRVELYIDRGKAAENKELFDRIHQHKEEIEKSFRGKLSWQRLNDKRGCRIAYPTKDGGYKNDESKWPAIQDAMIDAMIRLDKALTPHLMTLKEEVASAGEDRDEGEEGRGDAVDSGSGDTRQTMRKFWEGLLRRPNAKQPRRRAGKLWLLKHWLELASEGPGLHLVYVIGPADGRVELYIGRSARTAAENKELFDRIHQHKVEIEKAFGRELSWEPLRRACRIAYTLTVGGYKSDESKWPEIQGAMIDAMVGLEQALAPHLAKLKTE